jgi:hypothetical protein
LGPLLFALYINDFPAPQRGMLGLFADDAILLTNHKKGKKCIENLQESTEDVEDWCQDNDIKLNHQKCQYILFTRRYKFPRTPIYIGNTVLTRKLQVKYLGCILDKSLSFSPQVMYVRNKASQAVGMLSRITFPQARLTLRNKVILFKTIIRPILTYAAPVWAHASLANMKRLQTQQNIILRQFTRAPWYVRGKNIRKDLDLPLILDYIKELANAHFDRLRSSEHPHLREIVYYDPRIPTVHSRPMDLLSVDWMTN